MDLRLRAKYESEFLQKKDIYLFLGTTKEWHVRRAKNPFVIKSEAQMRLF